MDYLIKMTKKVAECTKKDYELLQKCEGVIDMPKCFFYHMS